MDFGKPDQTIYTFEARERKDTPYPHTDAWTRDYEEARRYAEENRLLLIENTYEWEDSQLLEDHAPKDWAITYGGTTKAIDDEPEVIERYATEDEAREDLARFYPGEKLYRVQNIPEN